MQGFDDQKFKKKTLTKILSFFDQKFLARLPGRPSYRRSLQPSKETSSTLKYV
jgi:hypothetical protein